MAQRLSVGAFIPFAGLQLWAGEYRNAIVTFAVAIMVGGLGRLAQVAESHLRGPVRILAWFVLVGSSLTEVAVTFAGLGFPTHLGLSALWAAVLAVAALVNCIRPVPGP